MRKPPHGPESNTRRSARRSTPGAGSNGNTCPAFTPVVQVRSLPRRQRLGGRSTSRQRTGNTLCNGSSSNSSSLASDCGSSFGQAQAPVRARSGNTQPPKHAVVGRRTTGTTIHNNYAKAHYWPMREIVTGPTCGTYFVSIVYVIRPVPWPAQWRYLPRVSTHVARAGGRDGGAPLSERATHVHQCWNRLRNLLSYAFDVCSVFSMGQWCV